MPKRKREDDEARDPAQQRRVQQRLKVALTKLGHAFKVSKGLERQKLGKRRRKAEEESYQKDVERIDSEIAALKTLDTAASAQLHLYKSLLKIKAVSDSSGLPDEVRNPPAASTDPATLNVHARLCNSNQVQDVLSTAVTDIQQSLGLDIDTSKSARKSRKRAKDFEPAKEASLLGRGDVKAPDEQQFSHPRTRQLNDGGDDSDAEHRDFDNRIASTSDEDDDEDHGVAALERQLAAEGVKRANGSKSNGYNVEADLSLSDSELDNRSASPEPQKAAPIKKSAFLPSLTMAGYISGSESDVEEHAGAPVKKNRRGQRARQQIWEQKYGAGAKHLQKPTRNDRDDGWNSKRGAVDANDRKNKGYDRRTRRTSPGYKSGGDGGRSLPHARKENAKKQDDGPLHPSWEAAKKAKEKRAVPIAFQGKKITF